MCARPASTVHILCTCVLFSSVLSVTSHPISHVFCCLRSVSHLYAGPVAFLLITTLMQIVTETCKDQLTASLQLVSHCPRPGFFIHTPNLNQINLHEIPSLLDPTSPVSHTSCLSCGLCGGEMGWAREGQGQANSSLHAFLCTGLKQNLSPLPFISMPLCGHAPAVLASARALGISDQAKTRSLPGGLSRSLTLVPFLAYPLYCNLWSLLEKKKN